MSELSEVQVTKDDERLADEFWQAWEDYRDGRIKACPSLKHQFAYARADLRAELEQAERERDHAKQRLRGWHDEYHMPVDGKRVGFPGCDCSVAQFLRGEG